MLPKTHPCESRLTLRSPSAWKRILAGSFIFLLAITGVIALHALNSRIGRLSVSRKVEPFTITDLHGRKFQLGNASATKTALLFFTPSCPYCQVEMSHFDALSQFNGKGLKVYAISLGSTQQTRDFSREEQVGNLYVAAPGTASRLGLVKLPALLLVDRKGEIRAVEEGERSPKYEALILSRFRGNIPIDHPE